MENPSISSQSQDQNNNEKEKKIKDFVCPCGRSYGSYPAVYAHIKRKHDGIAPGQIVRPKSVRKRGRPFKSLNTLEPTQKRDDYYYYKKLQKNVQKQEVPPKNYYPFQSYLKQHRPYLSEQQLQLQKKLYAQAKRGYYGAPPQYRPYDYPPFDDFYHRGQMDPYYRNFSAPFNNQFYPPPQHYPPYLPPYRIQEPRQIMERQQKARTANQNNELKPQIYQGMPIQGRMQNNHRQIGQGQSLLGRNFTSQNFQNELMENKAISNDQILSDFNPDQYEQVSVMMPLGDDKYKELKMLQKKKQQYSGLQKMSHFQQGAMIPSKSFNQIHVNSESQIFPFLPSQSKQVVQVKIQKEPELNLQTIERQLQQKFIPIQNGIMNFLQPILQEDIKHAKAHSQSKSSNENEQVNSSEKQIITQKDKQLEASKLKQKMTIKQILNQPIFKSIYQQIKRNRNQQDQQNFIQTSFETVLNEFLKYLDSFLQSEQYAQVKMFIILFYEYVFDKAHILNSQPWPRAYQMSQYFTDFIQQHLSSRIINNYRSLSKYYLFRNVSYCGGAMMMWLSNWLAIKQYVSNKLSRAYVQTQFSKENKQNKTYQQNYSSYVSTMIGQYQEKPKRKRITVQSHSAQKKQIQNGESRQINVHSNQNQQSAEVNIQPLKIAPQNNKAEINNVENAQEVKQADNNQEKQGKELE